MNYNNIVRQESHNWVVVYASDGGCVSSQSVEANLLLLILQELKILRHTEEIELKNERAR